MTTDLERLYLPACAQLRLFRAGQLSPVEMLEAQLARIEAVNPRVNAVALQLFEEAREQAKHAEDRYRRGAARALEGVTLAVKDDTDVAGKPTASGSGLFRDYIAPASHPMVQRYVDAGAIVHMKTTVPEFCMSGVTKSALWGVTRNPWNLEYTPAGSSGGSGAALAAGMTTLATGSDAGGSIRLPASVNGVYGVKPPQGRFPTVVPWTLSPHSVYGPMARTMSDLAFMYDLGNGPAGYDHTAQPKLRMPARMPTVAGMRIAYSPDLGYAQIDPEVRRNTEAALRHFEALGVEVEEVELGWTPEKVTEAFLGTLLTGYWRNFMDNVAEMVSAPTDVSDHFWHMHERSHGLPAGIVERAAELVAELNQHIAAVYSAGFDAIVCPTTGLPSVAAINEPFVDKLSINGVDVDGLTGWWLTHPFNVLYTHPIIVAQTGRAASNVPTSIQIIADRYDDITAFALAAAYERAAPPLYTGDAFPDFRGRI